jgi:hypothetical protein
VNIQWVFSERIRSAAQRTRLENLECKVEARIPMDDGYSALMSITTIIEKLLCGIRDGGERDVRVLKDELVLYAELGRSLGELPGRSVVKSKGIIETRIEVVIVDIRDESRKVRGVYVLCIEAGLASGEGCEGGDSSKHHS